MSLITKIGVLRYKARDGFNFLLSRGFFYLIRFICTLRGHDPLYDDDTTCYFCGKDTYENRIVLQGPVKKEPQSSPLLPKPGVKIDDAS